MVQKCIIEDDVFKPTITDCREVFRTINRSVFGDELKMPNFRLVTSSDFWGECVGDASDNSKCTIKMNKKFLSKKLFVFTMAHEMVHQWEWLVYEEMSHGKKFFQWRNELAKFNITLTRVYRIKHYTLNQ